MRTHCQYGYPLDAPRVFLGIFKGEIIATKPIEKPFLNDGCYDTNKLHLYLREMEIEKEIIYNNSKSIEWYGVCVPYELYQKQLYDKKAG